jgi:hypothetical protein
VAYLRFTPDEYRAIANLCRPFDLRNTRPRLVKQMLVASLADPLPPLADRIARLDHNQFHLLLIHLQGRAPVERPHGLTAGEVELAVEAGGPWLAQARFAHMLKRAIVQRLAERHTDLAAKVERLSLAQFAQLSQQVRERARGNN